ncbi:MAG: HDIG domain-containing protein [Oscillospiraceae bacterium]|nr:HDIG domain-containing protein [Ruminococcus sp.]MDE6708153.1 HDIG domain-containing protein [Oscillospiraceae bacterium]
MNLEITNKILANKNYLHELALLAKLEQNRIFCKHDIEHFLAVARIMLIMCHEKKIIINPDIIYATALLHDIGRTEEYKNHIPHDIASAQKAEIILNEINCESEIKNKIIAMIKNHGNGNFIDNSPENIFYQADKKARLCFCCPAREKCNWSEDKKNLNIEI